MMRDENLRNGRVLSWDIRRAYRRVKYLLRKSVRRGSGSSWQNCRAYRRGSKILNRGRKCDGRAGWRRLVLGRGIHVQVLSWDIRRAYRRVQKLLWKSMRRGSGSSWQNRRAYRRGSKNMNRGRKCDGRAGWRRLVLGRGMYVRRAYRRISEIGKRRLHIYETRGRRRLLRLKIQRRLRGTIMNRVDGQD
jgi:hypothetical protein